jgi:hypothetical protein
MLWQLLGIVFATMVIGLVFRLDRRAGVDRDEAEFLARTAGQEAGEHTPGEPR